MVDKKNLKEIDHKLQHQLGDFLRLRKNVNPRMEALRIFIIYLLVGGLWILLSDKVLAILVEDPEIFKAIQLYKGWLYVLITGVIFYFIISNRMMLFKMAIDEVFHGYEELSATHEELTAMDEELMQQYKEIQKHRDALMISDQRYQLAVEGANDGIWDWDLQTGEYFFSLKYKSTFGYEGQELKDDLETWQQLFHPDDRQKALDAVEAYLNSKKGIYENTYRVRRKDGGYLWILSRGKAVWDREGKAIRIAGSHTDITERINMEERLHALAYFDPLTKLPNRIMLQEEVSKKIKEAEENNKKLAFLNFDVDNFKNINDTMGHKAGDKLIQFIANTLAYYIKPPNLVARLGGDEFAIVLMDIKDNEEIILQVNKIKDYLRKPWSLGELEFFISVSIGIAIYPNHGTDVAELMQNADTAMSHMKANQKDGFCIYMSDMRKKTWEYVHMSNQLRYAINNQEFQLYYQPQIDLSTDKIIGIEALIRWIHPEKGFISPMEFIPFAEETGYIGEIEEWVLKTACKQKKLWKENGYDDIKISINLSSKMLTQPNLVPNIRKILEMYYIKCGDIELEITETAVIDNLEKAIEVLHQLREFAITIALDDFGTGYSSLTYLQKLPIDILKVDRGFISNIDTEEEECYILKTVIDLAHNLGLKVVAEGIETKEQLDFLKRNGCDIGQGYYFSKPVPVEDIESLLKEKTQ
ncbi:PAS domain S-box-containing protein/diguanylate cyclase (GGDEF) domain-containing protein [Natronincola peptidivorans]|uniref:PAS domain S-box-containing protein/diguanylate cyclase (GGDEF) domain-containing protein n=1 Tax=Natronincola peptidivorans TaxID=426128 RepID=A0A1I0DZ35_9FIRM|nr:PAS domain S-box-containing protein/diguanylate cyclase (GGDEF) domain-containing protein [Natronincola peptidivorans]